ncbi:hypothetical protein CF327_g7592 [Tilletia walkeri]|nr:hypothetical protein CF327_g7592 [Tilletia walkeri]
MASHSAPTAAGMVVDQPGAAGAHALSSVQQISQPFSQLTISAANAGPTDIAKLTVSDAMAAFETSVALFNQLADYTGVAGPFLKMGLGFVQEIIKIVDEVKTNKEECAEFIKSALDIYNYLAQAARSAGCPILPGSSAALAIEPVLRSLKDFKAEIESYSTLRWFKRTLKRGEIKSVLEKRTKELDRKLLMLTAASGFTNGIRSDYRMFLASTAASPTNASDPTVSMVEEPEEIQAQQPAEAPLQIQDTQSNSSSDSQLFNDSVQQNLQQVSTSVNEVIRKNSLLNTDGQPSTADASDAQLQRPFTSEEQRKLEQLRHDMERLFQPGDSEDLEGIFHIQSGAATAEQDDPADSAVKLLVELCKGSNTNLEEPTLISLRKLSGYLETLGLLDEVLTVDQVLAALCRRKVINGHALDQTNLAAALRHLGGSLYSVGRIDEALAASQEALNIVEPMARREPIKYNAHLARALRLVALLQDKVGNHEAAMEGDSKALKIIRSLHKANPAAFEEDLASTLHNYSVWLGDAGRHEEALKAIEECLAMRRSLHERRPAAFEADLAMTLNNYSNGLREAGRHEEALKAIEECLAMRRSLYKRRPAAFEADLALTLLNYSNRLGEVGRHEEALKVIEECLAMYRSLHERRPAAFEAGLARTLNNYSNQLSEAGRHEEALKATEECLAMRRSLHERRPAAFEADLAMTLGNYSNRLGKVGRHEEALKVIEECLTIFRFLYKRRPAAFEADLARTLMNYSVPLSILGRHEEALRVIEECLAMRRSLHERRPAAFAAILAKTLSIYSTRLKSVGRHDEALKATEESLAV